MTTSVHTRDTVHGLFYSYAHEDRGLQEELKKYLRSLEHEGLIRGWDDRMIGGGSEWEGQISDALESADVILLLVSADFIDSDYCWDVEMRRALVRHKAKEALVVPVILRPCLWQTAPFAILQCLPDEARAIILWEPTEQGYLNVAQGLRDALKARDEAATVGKTSSSSRRDSQARVLDAAIAGVVPVGRATDVVAMVRTVDSRGLTAILEVDASYSARPDDVKSQPMTIAFERGPSGDLEAAEVVLRLESSDFDPPVQEKTIEVPPGGDSRTCAFLVSAKRDGPLILSLELQRKGVSLVQHLLRAEGSSNLDRRAVPPYVVGSSASPEALWSGSEATLIRRHPERPDDTRADSPSSPAPSVSARPEPEPEPPAPAASSPVEWAPEPSASARPAPAASARRGSSSRLGGKWLWRGIGGLGAVTALASAGILLGRWVAGSGTDFAASTLILAAVAFGLVALAIAAWKLRRGRIRSRW